MEQSLQQMNAAQRLQIWSERIADCRSSGMSVREWCRRAGVPEKTYYYWQQKLYRMIRSQPDFIEISAVQNEVRQEIIASVQLGEMQVNIHASRDEESLRALLRALKSC